jgi:outer membrane lipoprotein SlyB
MAFIYYGQGVSSLYRDFVERLMSQLALRGTEITHQNIGDTSSRMDVKHTGEQGQMEITIDLENVRVSYTVDRERKEVKKGIAGAIAGAGLGGLLGGIVRGGRDVSDVIGGALGGAAAGGAYGAYDGYEASREERTAFAEVLAQAVKDVEDELQSILEGQEEAREALRERGRQKREEDLAKTEELRELLEELYGDLLAVQEEVELAATEGQDVRKSRARTDRAETLYQEAEAALGDSNHAIVKAKAKAARAMVDGARELLDAAE